MSDTLHNIKRLPAETRSQLRSTQILTSLPQIVSELLQNSLDANANHVDVGINHKEWMCWVQDNGVGISKDGLERLGAGNEAGRYSVFPYIFQVWITEELNSHLTDTSKVYAPEFTGSVSSFGFRGEGGHIRYLRKKCLQLYSALASAANISCLEICSRTAKSKNTWSLILKVG